MVVAMPTYSCCMFIHMLMHAVCKTSFIYTALKWLVITLLCIQHVLVTFLVQDELGIHLLYFCIDCRNALFNS